MKKYRVKYAGKPYVFYKANNLGELLGLIKADTQKSVYFTTDTAQIRGSIHDASDEKSLATFCEVTYVVYKDITLFDINNDKVGSYVVINDVSAAVVTDFVRNKFDNNELVTMRVFDDVDEFIVFNEDKRFYGRVVVSERKPSYVIKDTQNGKYFTRQNFGGFYANSENAYTTTDKRETDYTVIYLNNLYGMVNRFIVEEIFI